MQTEGRQVDLGGRHLDAWVEVRDSDTGEPLYSFLTASRALEGDEVTLTHQIGVRVSAS